MRSRWVTKMTVDELRAEYDANLGRPWRITRNRKILDELRRRNQPLEKPKPLLDVEPQRDPFGVEWLDWLLRLWDRGEHGRVFEILRSLPRLVVAFVTIKLYEHAVTVERNPETCFARHDFVRLVTEEARKSKPEPEISDTVSVKEVSCRPTRPACNMPR